MRCLLIFLSIWATVYGYDILCVFSMTSKSHSILARGIVDSLVTAGHTVTFVTPHPPKESIKGVTVIDTSHTIEVMRGFDKLAIEKKVTLTTGLPMMKRNIRIISNMTLTPELKKLLIEKQYDAVVTQYFFNDFESGYAAVQGVPWIVLSGTILPPSLQAIVDEPRSVPILPSFYSDYPVPMNFWQRLVTSLTYYGINFFNWWEKNKNEAVYQDLFTPIAAQRGVTLPPFNEASNNISILLVNSHPTIGPPLSLSPNVIDVAGFHIDENIPALPEDLQKLLDSSPQGVIYFSMGSVIKSTNIPEKTRQKLLEIFSKLPYTVLWKFEDDMMELPKNVHVRQWMPQSSILAHKYTKYFITHGGMLSSLEAIHHGVPIIAVPMYGDQLSNARRAVRLGYAMMVDYDDIEKLPEELEKALEVMLGDDRFSKRAKELSSLFNKRPVPPSKLISHYVELAIESKGAYHLRSKSLLYKWYERTMVDQILFLAVILYIIYYILKKTLLRLVSGKQQKDKTIKLKKEN